MACADEMLAVAAARRDELAALGLGPRPRRKVAVLACMDARMDLFVMLGLACGDAHIIRNAGGLVTDDTLRSLSVSQRLLGTEEIVVVMHEGCGLHGASDDRFAQELTADGAARAGGSGPSRISRRLSATVSHCCARARSSRHATRFEGSSSTRRPVRYARSSSLLNEGAKRGVVDLLGQRLVSEHPTERTVFAFADLDRFSEAG